MFKNNNAHDIISLIKNFLSCSKSFLLFSANVLTVFFGKFYNKQYSVNDQKMSRQPRVVNLRIIFTSAIFPAIFVIFEVAYWSHYNIMSYEEVDDLIYLNK